MKLFILILSFLFVYSIGKAQDTTSQQPADTTTSQIDTSASVNTAPPALPAYEQPECPVDGYLWQPGYWAYSLVYGDYYWVPGAWVAPPEIGLLWTPCYWGYVGGLYLFHGGYWGASVGFYGGINYGYGYQGRGYVGGEWHDGAFRYNTAVVNVNTAVVHNTYVNNRVIVNGGINRSSFNGQGGVMARPNAQEMVAMKERHVMPTAEQVAHQRQATTNKGQFAAANHGKPAKVTMNKVNGTAFNQSGRSPSAPTANRMPASQSGTNANLKAADNHSTQPPRESGQPNRPSGQLNRSSGQSNRPSGQSNRQASTRSQQSTQQPRQTTQQPRQTPRQTSTAQQPRQTTRETPQPRQSSQPAREQTQTRSAPQPARQQTRAPAPAPAPSRSRKN